jgi:hypothetical protein
VLMRVVLPNPDSPKRISCVWRKGASNILARHIKPTNNHNGEVSWFLWQRQTLAMPIRSVDVRSKVVINDSRMHQTRGLPAMAPARDPNVSRVV